MLTFTLLPPQYAPLGGPLRYRIAGGGARTLDIRIRDAAGAVLGAKRFVSADEADFDIAPCVRRAVAFAPQAGATGVLPDAAVTVTVEAQEQDDQTTLVTAPARTFLPCREAVAVPALLTAMPRLRLIGPGETDFLTLLTAGAATVTVTAEGCGSTVAQVYPVPGAGMHLFRLDMRDFQGAETLTVDAGVCGEAVYSVAVPPEGAQRLAWRSAAGSLEHYTFPVVRTETVRAVKSRAYGPGGHVVVRTEGERQTRLCSACERREVLDALAGLLTAPEAWLVRSGGYTPVDVVSDEAEVVRYGALPALEVVVRPKYKTCEVWN